MGPRSVNRHKAIPSLGIQPSPTLTSQLTAATSSLGHEVSPDSATDPEAGPEVDLSTLRHGNSVDFWGEVLGFKIWAKFESSRTLCIPYWVGGGGLAMGWAKTGRLLTFVGGN